MEPSIVLWKRNGTTFNLSEFHLPDPYEIKDSPVTDSSWNFLEHEDDSYNTPSGTDGFRSNLWFLIPLIIILPIVRYFCIVTIRSWCRRNIWGSCYQSGSDTSRLVDSMESGNIPTTQATTEINNVRVDQYAMNSGGAQHNRSMDGTDFLSYDKPPAYSTAVSGDLSGDTFPSVSVRDSAESPPPVYEERCIRSS